MGRKKGCKLRQVGGAVAIGGMAGLFQRDVDGVARHVERREGPCVQLIGQRLALGVVFGRGRQLRHGIGPLKPGAADLSRDRARSKENTCVVS